MSDDRSAKALARKICRHVGLLYGPSTEDKVARMIVADRAAFLRAEAARLETRATSLRTSGLPNIYQAERLHTAAIYCEERAAALEGMEDSHGR